MIISIKAKNVHDRLMDLFMEKDAQTSYANKIKNMHNF